MLPFPIQIQLGEPIYEQIVRAVKKAVAAGQLQPLIEQLVIESAHHGLTADELLELIRQQHKKIHGNDH